MQLADLRNRVAAVVRPAAAHEAEAAQSAALLLSVQQVAKRLGVSARSIWRLDSAARLPRPVRLGRSVRWSRDEIERWVAAGCPDRREREATKDGRNGNRGSRNSRRSPR